MPESKLNLGTVFEEFKEKIRRVELERDTLAEMLMNEVLAHREVSREKAQQEIQMEMFWRVASRI